MLFQRIYDGKLAQAAYLIGCRKTGEALIIDPERDVDRYIRIAEENGLEIVAAAETHIHADFLSGARELAERVGAKLYLSGEGGDDWSYRWLDKKSGGGWYTHQLLFDGDVFTVGNIEVKAVHTPGHTPEHLSYLITDVGGGTDDPIGLATGDFVFVGDVGRPDLLETAAGQAGAKEPSARLLHDSLRWFDHLEPHLQIWPGHGAGSACGKALGDLPQSTVGYEKRTNEAVRRSATGVDAFVAFILEDQPDPPLYFARMKRENRDGSAILGSLPQPGLMVPRDVAERLKEGAAVLLDTRSWPEFREGHLKGSYHTPLDKSFPTVAGSYVRPEESVYLVLDTDDVAEAVTDLIRVGIDRIAGYVLPEALETLMSEHEEMKERVPSITLAEFARRFNANDALPVLDVRGAPEYARGHIRGAGQIAHTRIAAGLESIPANERVYVHCQTGIRSAAATAYLRAHGRDGVWIEGSFPQFAEAGLPIETGATP